MTSLNKLLVSTLHADFDDYPWIQADPGMEIKLVHARLQDNLTVIQFRAQPGARTGLHRHTGLVVGLTTKGAWSHDPHNFPYLPNSYVCEPLGELHRFHNGPEISEAYYLSLGDAEYFDDTGRELLYRTNVPQFVEFYMNKCEEIGKPRPNVFR